MKATCKILFIVVAMTLSENAIRAEISDVEIHCIPNKMDASGNQTTLMKEHWQ